MKGLYNRIFAFLAITAVSSTVATAYAQAQTVPFVTNVVYSSQQTGGITTDGKDGEDGKDGQDGAPGVSGRSVINVDRDSGASVRIESTMNNGQEVISAQKTAPSFGFATSSTVEVKAASASSSSTASDQSALLALQEALFSLQLMLVKYVSVLF